MKEFGPTTPPQLWARLAELCRKSGGIQGLLNRAMPREPVEPRLLYSAGGVHPGVGSAPAPGLFTPAGQQLVAVDPWSSTTAGGAGAPPGTAPPGFFPQHPGTADHHPGSVFSRGGAWGSASTPLLQSAGASGSWVPNGARGGGEGGGGGGGGGCRGGGRVSRAHSPFLGPPRGPLSGPHRGESSVDESGLLCWPRSAPSKLRGKKGKLKKVVHPLRTKGGACLCLLGF